MGLEAVILPHDSIYVPSSSKECYAMVGGRCVVDGIGKREEETKGLVAAVGDRVADGSGTSGGGAELGRERGREASDSAPHGGWGLLCTSVLKSLEEECDLDLLSPETFAGEGTFVDADEHGPGATGAAAASGMKRRRTKCRKNREEVETQRMTHIAVERNRRKQMNEYLSVLRSLLPPSHVQRGDQASIVGGAINFVKELEQLLQSLEAQKRVKEQRLPDADATAGRSSSSPFSRFFTLPQYLSSTLSSAPSSDPLTAGAAGSDQAAEMNHRRPAVADIQVTMVESHANLRVLSRRRPKLLLRLVAGLLGLRLSVLHLNVTTAVDRMVLYSFSLKVEDDCQLSSGDDIAASVHQMLGKIQEEAGF